MMSQDVRRDVLDGKLVLGCAIFPRGSWHPKDHTGGFILSESGRTAGPQLEQTFGAIFAHAGENSRERVRRRSAIHRGFKEEIE